MLEGNFNRVKFGYTGHRLEERTGHWSALHRYLDPRAGRWTQRDPRGSIDGQNRYLYGLGAPLTYWDRLGLTAVDFGGRRFLESAIRATQIGSSLLAIIESQSSGKWCNIKLKIRYEDGAGREVAGGARVSVPIGTVKADIDRLLRAGDPNALKSLVFANTTGPVTTMPGGRMSADLTSTIFEGSNDVALFVDKAYPNTRLAPGFEALEWSANLRVLKADRPDLALAGSIVHELGHVAALVTKGNVNDHGPPALSAVLFWLSYGYPP